jgi:hypothetical protein
MSGLKPPKPLIVNTDNDMVQEYVDWLDVYANYTIASKMNKKEDAVQVANFKHVIGRDAIKVLSNLNRTANESKDLATIKTKLKNHFAPAKNKTYERCQFHRIKQ